MTTNKDEIELLNKSTPLQKFNALWFGIEKHMGVDPDCVHWADEIRHALSEPEPITSEDKMKALRELNAAASFRSNRDDPVRKVCMLSPDNVITIRKALSQSEPTSDIDADALRQYWTECQEERGDAEYPEITISFSEYELLHENMEETLRRIENGDG